MRNLDVDENLEKSNRMNYSMAPSLTFLPIEIMIEILSRLPVKSLIQLSSVCKSWYALVRNPNFINTHLNRTISNHANNSAYIFVMTMFYCHVRAETTLTTFVRQEYNPMRFNSILYQIDCCNPCQVGCCNGLILLENEENLYLFNPSIRKMITLPDSELYNEIRKEGRNPYQVSGFGFDEVFKDYKVVRVNYIVDKNLNFLREVPPRVEVYSLRAGSWRVIGANVTRSTRLGKWKVVCHGAIHWFADNELDGSQMILAFDIGEEVFREINLPDEYINTTFVNLYGMTPFVMDVMVFKGSLSLFVNDPECLSPEGDFMYNIWVMKEYGFAESWTKQFTIFTPMPIGRGYGFTRSGKLIVVDEDCSLASWDPDNHFKYLGDCSEYFVIDVDFMESLILLEDQNCV